MIGISVEEFVISHLVWLRRKVYYDEDERRSGLLELD